MSGSQSMKVFDISSGEVLREFGKGQRTVESMAYVILK